MSQEILSETEISNSNDSPKVPPSLRTANRTEHQGIKLEIIAGELPEDMHGHVFIVTSVGTVDSNGLPYKNGNSLLCGDGMIYRLDFDVQNEVRLTTSLVKPPDYYADKETSNKKSRYHKYRFYNYGTIRFSPILGIRNQLNTAFLPMKFSSDSPERLLVAYDAGRPYEIDTQSLDVVTPIGSNKEWHSETGNTLAYTFPAFLSTAHPVFDHNTKEMFTVNYGRSMPNLLGIITSIYNIGQSLSNINDFLSRNGLQGSFDLARKFLIHKFSSLYINYVKKIKTEKIEKDTQSQTISDFVYLMRWDGTKSLKQWKLLLNGFPVRIKQTIHQIGISKNYVIIMDTCFTVGLEEVINNPLPDCPELEGRLREKLDPLPNPQTVVYIVPRDQLKDENQEVEVKQAVVPLEAAHFLVDYDNHNLKEEITLHVAHISGMKVSDWIREYDTSAYPDYKPNYNPKDVSGLVPGQADIGRMGRYVINGDTGEILNKQIMCHPKCTWGTDLYTYRELDNEGKPLTQLDDIYWCSFGLWKDLMTESIATQYKGYKNRQIPLEEVLRMAKQGVGASLFRLSNESRDQPPVIVDKHELPEGYVLLSPQFVPRSRVNIEVDDNTKISTDGYIICPVWYETKNEFWIFDAAHLDKGPLCKLASSPSNILDFAMTLHTTWLAEIGERQAPYCIDVYEDYRDLVERASGKHHHDIEELFKHHIYPHFKCPKSSN